MDWSSHLPPGWLPPSCSWRSGEKRDDCGGGVRRFEGSWVSSASPPRDGGEKENEEGGQVLLLAWGGRGRWALRALKAAFPLALPCAPPPRPWPGFKPLSSLAGLHAELLPVGRLLCLRLGAWVRASVERRHGAAFGIGVQAAVRRRVAGLELGGALHLLQSTDCRNTWRRNMNGGRGWGRLTTGFQNDIVSEELWLSICLVL